jgi:hypothetical protein
MRADHTYRALSFDFSVIPPFKWAYSFDNSVIEGTIFVPKNAALTEGGKKFPILATKLVSKTATEILSQLASQTGALLGYQ